MATTASSPLSSPPVDASPIPNSSMPSALVAVAQPAPATPAKRPLSAEDVKHPTSSPLPLSQVDGGTDSKAPAKKRQKLTEAEKEEKRKEREAKEREREAKEKERAEKKAERDEKKKIKDEEKRKKEEEKKKKEEEKKKKEEEKAKKEKAQLKLNNFFTKPADSPGKPQSSQDVAVKVDGPASESTTSTSSTNAVLPEAEKTVNDYEKTFHPFFVKSGVTVAPLHYFQKDENYKKVITRSLDEALSLPRQPDKEEATNIPEEPAPLRTITREEFLQLCDIPSHKTTRRGKLLGYGTKDILARINSPDDPSLPPLEPSRDNKSRSATYYIRLLNRLPHKLLKFAEDVRPPYVGTYTKMPIDTSLARGRNPFKKALPRVNYDYDSEAEWVADEEGEELLSGDEDEEDDESASDDMEGFLDDENDAGVNRRGVGTLVATSSGLCWEDENGKSQRADFEGMRMEVLIEGLSAPINPFTDYWAPLESAKTSTTLSTRVTAMDPPRLPLQITNRLQAPAVAAAAIDGSKKPRSMVPAEQLEDFKRAIEGSDMTKTGLIEVLKKQFPKIPKEAIKNTIGQVAERVGSKQDDKRWVLL